MVNDVPLIYDFQITHHHRSLIYPYLCICDIDNTMALFNSNVDCNAEENCKSYCIPNGYPATSSYYCKENYIKHLFDLLNPWCGKCCPHVTGRTVAWSRLTLQKRLGFLRFSRRQRSQEGPKLFPSRTFWFPPARGAQGSASIGPGPGRSRAGVLFRPRSTRSGVVRDIFVREREIRRIICNKMDFD